MQKNRLLLLFTTTGYQAAAFKEAAEKLGIAVVAGSDRCHVLEDPWRDGAIPLRFEEPTASVESIVQYASHHRLDAVLPIGDKPTLTAAMACQALGLLHNSPVCGLYTEGRFQTFSAKRIATSHTHGTGCTYSAAITAELAKGTELIRAVEAAKRYITRAIETNPALGHGYGPVNHMAPI